MAQVTVLVNGRNYTLACEDGEEEHLTALAAFIDSRVAELGRSVGQVGDARLMLMASLVVADELAVAHERAEELEHEIEQLKQKPPEIAEAPPAAANTMNEEAFAELIETAAKRIEDIAARLQ
jgi:cell division protein ZapA